MQFLLLYGLPVRQKIINFKLTGGVGYLSEGKLFCCLFSQSHLDLGLCLVNSVTFIA